MLSLKAVGVTVAVSCIGVGLLAGCGTGGQSTSAAPSEVAPSREAGLFSTPRPIKLIVNNHTSKDLSVRRHFEPIGAVEAEIISPDAPEPQPWQQVAKYSSFQSLADEKLGAAPLSIEIGDAKNLDQISVYNPSWRDPVANIATKTDGEFTRINGGKNVKTYKIEAQPSSLTDSKAKEYASWNSNVTGNKYVLSFDDSPGKYMTIYLRVRN